MPPMMNIRKIKKYMYKLITSIIIKTQKFMYKLIESIIIKTQKFIITLIKPVILMGIKMQKLMYKHIKPVIDRMLDKAINYLTSNLKKMKQLLESLENANKLVKPYVTFSVMDALIKTLPIQLILVVLDFRLSLIEQFFFYLIGFSLMFGTEAYFFYFCPNDYSALLLDASLQANPRFPIKPDVFYDMEKLSQLQGNLIETPDLSDASGNMDTPGADPTKPKKFENIYKTVRNVGVIFITIVFIGTFAR